MSPLLAVASAALAGGLVFAHLDALAGMVRQWQVSPMYSYAITVPFISAYLVWSRRADLAALRPAGSWLAAAPVLAVGILMLLAGKAGGIQVIQQLAFLVSLLGIILALFGRAYVRVVWAALAYLLLMVPLWDGLTESLHVPFQNQSAAIGTWMVRLFGIPAFRDGVFIELPNLSIEVARACSGVNYLVAVIALGLPLAYVYLRSPWRRVLLVTGAMAVAAFSNALRVAMICVLSYYELGSPLHGPFHLLHGLFVAGIGYVALFAGLRWLTAGEAGESRPSSPVAAARHISALPLGALTGLAIVFWGLAATPAAHSAKAVALGSGLENLPLRLADWEGHPVAAPPGDVPFWPGADDQLRRRYTDSGGRALEVYVAYFGSQRQGHELASAAASDLHRTASAARVPLGAGGALPANRVQLPDGRVALFWYDIDGAVVSGRYETLARTAWNGVIRGRSNGAVVLISELPRRPAAAAGTFGDADALAALVYDALGRSLPGRTPPLENQ